MNYILKITFPRISKNVVDKSHSDDRKKNQTIIKKDMNHRIRTNLVPEI